MSDQPAGACPDCGTDVTSENGVQFWCPECKKHVPAASLLGARPSDRMPGRGLCYAKPVPLEQGGGIECLCDCATTTILHVDVEGALLEAREIAFTCDNCQSVHWLTLYPVQEKP